MADFIVSIAREIVCSTVTFIELRRLYGQLVVFKRKFLFILVLTLLTATQKKKQR